MDSFYYIKNNPNLSIYIPNCFFTRKVYDPSLNDCVELVYDPSLNDRVKLWINEICTNYIVKFVKCYWNNKSCEILGSLRNGRTLTFSTHFFLLLSFFNSKSAFKKVPFSLSPTATLVPSFHFNISYHLFHLQSSFSFEVSYELWLFLRPKMY